MGGQRTLSRTLRADGIGRLAWGMKNGLGMSRPRWATLKGTRKAAWFRHAQPKAQCVEATLTGSVQRLQAEEQVGLNRLP
jgi:hypothetical protein